MTMQFQNYGNSGMQVSRIGLGALQIGDTSIDESQASEVLNAAIDSGVNLIDTAPGYQLSEERIGKLVSHRRREFFLSTKLGYKVEGVPDWTFDCIVQGVERALRLMRTDYLDIAHLHSCPRSTLERAEVIDALEHVKQSGKVRAIAYSGDADALNYAISTKRFDGFMASLNPFDQRVIDEALPQLQHKGLLIKRATANHPWRFTQQPHGDYCEPYWLRWKTMNPPDFGLAWGELSLRFALSFPQSTCAVIGTSKVKHLQESIAWAEKGRLANDELEALQSLFKAHDRDWVGQI
jgi:aryl-alcohol dehydrogenase-like predicted oxidoreductase